MKSANRPVAGQRSHMASPTPATPNRHRKTKYPTTFNKRRLPMGLITPDLPAVDPATWQSKGR